MTQTQPPIDPEAISPVETLQRDLEEIPSEGDNPELDYVADTPVEEATTQQPLVESTPTGEGDQPTPDTDENIDTDIQAAVGRKEEGEKQGPEVIEGPEGQVGDMRWDDRDDTSEGLSDDVAKSGVGEPEPEPEPEAEPEVTDDGTRASGIAGKLLLIAKTQLGVPYVYAGTAWGVGMDCSGFIQQVFRRVGINLPRVTYDMVEQGQKISSLAEAKPGDLIFTTGDIGMRRYGHAGIYLGNGLYIVAPRTGKNIQIQRITGRSLDAIRRYF